MNSIIICYWDYVLIFRQSQNAWMPTNTGLKKHFNGIIFFVRRCLKNKQTNNISQKPLL